MSGRFCGRAPLWKTISITDRDAFGRLRSAFHSSREAFGPHKVMTFGVGDIETNLSYANLRDLFRHAGVRYPRDMVTDTMPLAERNADPDREDALDIMAENKAEAGIK